MAPAPTLLATRAQPAQTPTMTTDAPPLESMLGRIADALETHRGRPISAAFGLQGAHAESADEFDALLDDVQSAGLSGVDRLNGASLTAKVIKTRECRPDVVLESHSRRVKQQLRVLPGGSLEFFSIQRTNGPRSLWKFQNVATHAGGSCWNSGRTSDPSTERAMAMTSHLYLVLEAAAADPQHNLGWAWPLLGLPDSEGRHNMQLSPLEQSGLISFQRNRCLRRSKTSTHESGHASDRFPKLQGCKLRSELASRAS